MFIILHVLLYCLLTLLLDRQTLISQNPHYLHMENQTTENTVQPDPCSPPQTLMTGKARLDPSLLSLTDRYTPSHCQSRLMTLVYIVRTSFFLVIV